MPPFLFMGNFSFFAVFITASLSNAVKCCKYMIILYFFLETHPAIC